MKVNIVIPCKNEELYIEECLNAVYNSQLISNVEFNVIVVDGNSTDSSLIILNRLKSQYDNLFIINNLKEITPVAFNMGINFSNCDFLQIVGARMIISNDYLQKSINILSNDQSIWCVGGRLINSYINSKSEAIASALDSSFAVGVGNFRILNKSSYVDTVSCPMFRYSIFDVVGIFDEELIRNQDDDFSFRILKKGGKIWFESSIVYKYYSRISIYYLFQQYYQYGFWKVFVNKKHNTITTFRQLFPLFFIFYLFFIALSVFVNFPPFFLLPLFFYFLLIGRVTFFKFKSLKDFYFIPLVYPIVHISYGYGYLRGIIDFILLKKSPLSMSKKLSR